MNRFLQNPFRLDLRSLAALRIGLASLVIIDLLLRLQEFQEFYTDQGVLSRLSLVRDVHSTFFNLHLCSGGWGLLSIWGLHILCALALLVGYRTRTAAFLTWYLLVSLQNRNPHILDGGDDELRLMLFWLPFLPVSARWSWDERRKGQPVADLTVSSVASFGYVLQLACVYLFAGLFKTDPIWTSEGTGLYYALCYEQFANGLGLFLRQFTGLIRFFSLLSFGFERVGWILLLIPVRIHFCRTLFLLCLLAFHGGIMCLMRIGLFPFVAIISGFGLIPGALWDRLGWPQTRPSQYSRSLKKLHPGVVFGLSLVTCLIVSWNWLFLHDKTIEHYPAPIKLLAYFTREMQTMDFFSPHPPLQNDWYVIDTTLASGAHLDLMRGTPVVDWNKPDSVGELFRNYRRRRWFQNLNEKPELRMPYARHLVDSWNQSHSDKIVHLQIWHLAMQSPAPGQPWPPPNKDLLADDGPR